MSASNNNNDSHSQYWAAKKQGKKDSDQGKEAQLERGGRRRPWRCRAVASAAALLALGFPALRWAEEEEGQLAGLPSLKAAPASAVSLFLIRRDRLLISLVS